MKTLYKYRTGNCSVTLFDDGTRIIDTPNDEPPVPEYPLSVDLKITNFCDNSHICKWCHEMSTVKGKHSDIAWIKNVFNNAPKGIEVAIGGGNPFAHPEFEAILQFFKDKGIVANVTINSGHLSKFADTINSFVEKGLITALGISYDKNYHNDLSLVKDKKNVVIHTISGINTPEEVWDLAREGYKVLLLGYKNWGFGKVFSERNTDVEEKKKVWYDNINQFFGKLNLSFDNLAVEQLDMKRFFPKDKWEESYQGDDGTVSMYVDAVTQKYAKNSTSSPIVAYRKTLKEMFESL